MKTDKRTLIPVLVIAVALAAFWLLLLSPKREKVAELTTTEQNLQASVNTYEQQIEEGLAARKEFPEDYQQLVLLGKSTPSDADSASFLVQINEVAAAAGVDFRGLEAGTAEASAAPPVPAPAVPAEPTTTAPEGEEAEGEATTTETTTPAVATEASAAALPIGSAIGPAGLAVLPFDLTFSRGDFFDVADFLAGLDRLVRTKDGRIVVDGRLITIDGFSLTADKLDGFPKLTANLRVTTYVTPESQGLTAGATPAAPATAPATLASATP